MNEQHQLPDDWKIVAFVWVTIIAGTLYMGVHGVLAALRNFGVIA